MSLVQTLQGLLFPDGLSGRLAVLALVCLASASLAHLFASLLLLRKFSREGPVIPLLLPKLESKWEESMFKLGVWLWLRRVGLVLLLASLFLALLQAGVFIHSVLAAGVVPAGWQRELAAHLQRALGILLLLGLAIVVRVVVGGLAGLFVTRAGNYVSASTAMVSAEDVERARRFLDGVEGAVSEAAEE